jgi:predicted MFS family arabinose efflux permease
LKLWAGQAISLLGSQVTSLAVSLTAAILLDATPSEMGLIGTLNVLPLVLLGLPAGLAVDRMRRRPIMIATDIGRALLMLSVPLAAFAGRLSMPQLYVVSFGMGCLSAVFRVAYGSLLPSVVSRSDLADGNAKLALAEAVARVAGPGLAGELVQVLTAPYAILVDCASFVVSAVSLAAIQAREEVHPLSQRGASQQLREGFVGVLGHTLLRPLFFGTALGNIADGLVFQSGILILFMTRELRFEPAVIGGVIAGLGIGGLIGAVLAGPVTRGLGIGATILGCMALWSIGYGGMAFIADTPAAPVFATVLLGTIGAINPVAGANIATVRQTLTPHHLLGRVTSVVNVGSMAALTVGSFAGGLIADSLGLRPTLVLGGALPLIALVWLVVSPVRALRRLDLAQGPG